ncbi:hypothetical protein [Microbulbifer celer]|uniref:Lipoprotein n=1 Tax=Microbulbifer celer TaxID=435905 RepID=A0ABW3UF94_9GAMM|nr:hypothetical protein [Microbulbifer celer]UFN56855.1 hypothetical protein LPW13_14960 [Microbulbifer celer]
MKKIILVAAITVFLGACAHVPLSTILEYRSFSIEELRYVDAVEIKARAKVDGGLELSEIGNSLELSFPDGAFSFPLIYEEKEKIGNTNIYELKLSDQGLRDYALFKSYLERNPHSRNFDLNISSKFEKPGPGVKEARISIFVKLGAESEYVEILSGYPVDLSSPGPA